MSKYENIQTKYHYDLLLKSGMFWEIYPELSGDWENDKDEILKDLSQKIPHNHVQNRRTSNQQTSLPR